MSAKSAPIYLDKTTLVIIPCSARKTSLRAKPVAEVSVLDQLPSDLSEQLADARRAIANNAQIDESTLAPAWRRYSGTLYHAAAPVLGNAIQRGQLPHLLILSGGYGIVHARDPIGTYNATLVLAHWPNDFATCDSRVCESQLSEQSNIASECQHWLRPGSEASSVAESWR